MAGGGRYIEYRHDGDDPVGTFGARRISSELKEWIRQESARRSCTQRRVVEDAIESFVMYRNQQPGLYPYEHLPRRSGINYRMILKIDLLQEALDLVERDKIFHGDLVTAAIRREMAKDGHQ